MNEGRTGRCQHETNWLDLESLGYQPTLYAQKLPSRALVTRGEAST